MLHGRIKRFWLFFGVAAIAAFLANTGSQFVINGVIDFRNSITIAITLGIVLAIIMASSQHTIK